MAGILGLSYYPDFLTPERLNKITADLETNTNWVGVSTSKKARKVIQYGYTYSYAGGSLRSTDPIPDIYAISENLSRVSPELQNWIPNQLIINQYLPGQGIAAHIDHTARFGDKIACVTIGSGIEIEFTRGAEKKTIYVEPNSLYVMSGEARYKWKHEIIARRADLVDGKTIPRGTRVSLTYRVILES
jgi:alkylated DNA repair dioxygenase AlkB